MRSYAALSRVFPRSYRAKLIAVVLVFTLLPMLVLVGWLMANNNAAPERVLVGTVIGLSLTLLGTALALLLIYKLLQPLRTAVAALDAYAQHRQLPELPVEATAQDEMGRLLRGIQRVLHTVDAGRRQLERHALEDSLTDALNRRGAGHALRASVAQAAASGEPFVLCVVDLDNLKTINDEHGHAAGDYALVSLVQSARECCLASSDWIGRWGGDEFLLGLHADPDVAMDRVRVWIDVLARPEPDTRPVLVSVGAAAWRPDLDAAQLYRQADAAMYRAKFAGGRRLVAHVERGGEGAMSAAEVA
jgi:diguanylate cyclase (GGDEF)-like protein